MKNMKNSILLAAAIYCCIAALPEKTALVLLAQTPRTNPDVAQQETVKAKEPEEINVKPEFRGIKLDMPREEVRQLLGKPARTNKNMDEFKLEGDDMLTVRFNSQNKVNVIQFYCTDAKRAPDWSDAVGDAQIQTKPNGSKFARKVVSAGKFWVSMFQAKSGSLTTLTISRQAN